MRRYIRKNRLIALALTLCFVMVSVFSCAFIAAHANHDHDKGGANGGCATCERLVDAAQLLKQLCLALAVLGFVISSLAAIITSIRATVSPPAHITPVSLNVRMNN